MGWGGGKASPRATNHLQRRFSKVEPIFKLALSHILAGQAASTYPLPGGGCCLRVPPLPGEISSEPGAGCTASAREPGRGGWGAAGCRGRRVPGRRGRGGRRGLAVAGRFPSLRARRLARAPTLSLLARSHPAPSPPLRRRVGSDVTSAEIPPNCAARRRAAAGPGRAGSGSQLSARAARGERAGAPRGEAGEGGRGLRAEEPGAGERAGDRGEGRGPGPGAQTGASEARPLHSCNGGEDARRGWGGGGGGKGIRAKPGARSNQRGRAGASGRQPGTRGEPAGTQRKARAREAPHGVEQRTAGRV